MITDLFATASGFHVDALGEVVPPACRQPSSGPPLVTAVGVGEVLLEFPECRPRVPVRHVVPSLSVLTDIDYSVRFEVSTEIGGTWSPWVGTVGIGPAEFPSLPAATDAFTSDVDLFTAGASVERLRLRIRVRASDPRALLAAPWIATLSACDLGSLAPERSTVSTPRLPVPTRSQMEEPAEIARRICSPTSVAMVLDYWGAEPALGPLAAEIFHAGLNSYGVWPAAIRAAGRRGVAGYLLRFPDWASAAWCLERKLPIIASLRYAAGELTGAAIAETAGHLVVFTGAEADDVLVNDPAAATAAEVPRRYRLAEIRRVWLDRAGVGYVLFRR